MYSKKLTKQKFHQFKRLGLYWIIGIFCGNMISNFNNEYTSFEIFVLTYNENYKLILKFINYYKFIKYL